MFRSGLVCAHKYAKGDTPNLDNLKRVVYEQLQPIHFHVKQNCTYGPWLRDMYFCGVICSPKFEGKTHRQMNEMVEAAMKTVNLDNRVRFTCEPPSRWIRMKAKTRQRWNLDA